MNIHQKLIEVRKSVPYLQKAAEGQQYKYNSSSQVLGAVRKKLDDLNLLLITRITGKRVSMETVEFNDGKQKPKKTTTYFTELDLVMEWINGDSPEEKIEIPWYAQGVDIAGEKGVGKALTYGEKTFMLKQFSIATDQMDVDVFQNKMDENSKKLESLNSKSISEIKTEWLKQGYKANHLNEQVKKLYKCKLIELSEEQADDFLTKLREAEGRSA